MQSTWDADLHVLPASPMLEGAERELMGVAGAPYRLTEPLSRIASHYAAIVIDTRPSFSLMTEMGLLAATDAIVPVERYLEALAEEIASGEWVDISGIGKVQVVREEGKGYVTSITPGGQRVRRKVQMRLRTRIRLYEKFKGRYRTK